MRQWKKTIVVVLLALFCSFAAHAETLKIGLVDFQRALNEVEEGKKAQAQLKAQFEQKQQALAAKQENLKQLKDQLEAQRAALSADAMRQKEAEFRDKFMDLQKTLADYQREMATKEGELTKNILVNIRQVVQSVGAKGGYSMIFEKSQQTLLYAPTAVDLTTEVVSAYNSRK